MHMVQFISDGPVGFVSYVGGDSILLVLVVFCSSSAVSIIVAGEPQSGQKRGLSVGNPSKLKPLLHKLQNIGTQE